MTLEEMIGQVKAIEQELSRYYGPVAHARAFTDESDLRGSLIDAMSSARLLIDDLSEVCDQGDELQAKEDAQFKRSWQGGDKNG